MRVSRFHIGFKIGSLEIVGDLGKPYATSGRHRWKLRCACGCVFTTLAVYEYKDDATCEDCRRLAIQREVERRYRAGVVAAGCEILRTLRGSGERDTLYEVRCECGKPFTARREALDTKAHIRCQSCRNTKRSDHGDCALCAGLTHRVSGKRCRRCGLKFEELPPVRLQDVMRSSAGYTADSIHAFGR